MIKRILITGSSGYIGSHLLELIDAETLDIDNFTCDVTYHTDIRKDFSLPKEYDVVVHLAALVQVGESVKHPKDYYETNVLGTLNVLKNIKTKNFIFASTGAAENLGSPYAISKKVCEEIIQDYCTQNNINYTIFRFYNVIGCNKNITPTNPDGLFYALIKAIDTGKFNVYGTNYDTKDGTCVRDYVHVNEICSAIVTAISKPSNSIESLGHGKGHTVLEIVETFKRVNNIDFEVIPQDNREGDFPVSVLKDVSSYMQSLYTFDEMLKL
jgi:UDP-glucose 4-epimerase